MKKAIKRILKQLLTNLGLLVQKRRESAIVHKNLTVNRVKELNGAVRFFLVGCGTMGKHHANSLQIFKNKLSGIYDLNAASCKELKTKFAPNTIIYLSYDELLDQIEPLDILIIATTAESHFGLVEQAIAQGIKKIVLEKPVSTSLNESQLLVELAQKNNTLVYVNHIRRWNPLIQGLKRIMTSNIAGEVHSLHYHFGRAGMAMIGTHLFDLAAYLFDSVAVEVKGRLDTIERPNWRGKHFKDPSGRCELVLKNGINCSFDLSDSFELQQDFFILYGSAGRIEVDQNNGYINVLGSSGLMWHEEFPWLETFHSSLSNMLYELAKGIEPKCGLAEGHRALEIAIAVHHSNEHGGAAQTLPLTGEIVSKKFTFA